jgi:hypothetical protein
MTLTLTTANPPLIPADVRVVLEPTSTAWQQIETVLKKHYYKPDLQAARAVYACVCAHLLDGPPVWPMLVGAPGSMKTELLNGLRNWPKTHRIDQLTPQTFISGQIKDPANRDDTPAGLLHRIGKDGIILYPDFSTVLALRQESRASILSDMRRIYDGELRKEFGTADNLQQRSWQGRMTFVVATTPDVDMQYSVFQTLGERFVMLRWPRVGGVEAALAAMQQNGEAARAELVQAVDALYKSLRKIQPQVGPDMRHRIAALTEFTTRARTHVPRNGATKTVIYVPEAESATRLAQGLMQVVRGSALMDGRSTPTEEDYELARRVAFDCIPAARRAILDCLIEGKDLRDVPIPRSTRHYHCEDLALQGLIVGDQLSPLSHDMLSMAAVIST